MDGTTVAAVHGVTTCLDGAQHGADLVQEGRGLGRIVEVRHGEGDMETNRNMRSHWDLGGERKGHGDGRGSRKQGRKLCGYGYGYGGNPSSVAVAMAMAMAP